MIKQRGFTLIELIITLTIFVLVMFALFALYENYGKIFGSQEVLFNIGGSATATMNELQQNILQADLITNHVFSSGAYNSDTSTLVLELPAFEADGTPTYQWDYVVFYVDGNKLYRLMETVPTSRRASGLKLLSDTVTGLTFTYDNADPTLSANVLVNLTTQSRSGHQTQTYNLQQQVYLRNQ